MRQIALLLPFLLSACAAPPPPVAYSPSVAPRAPTTQATATAPKNPFQEERERTANVQWSTLCHEDKIHDRNDCILMAHISDTGSLGSSFNGRDWSFTSSRGPIQTLSVRLDRRPPIDVRCNLTTSCSFPAAASRAFTQGLEAGATSLMIQVVGPRVLANRDDLTLSGYAEAKVAQAEKRTTMYELMNPSRRR